MINSPAGLPDHLCVSDVERSAPTGRAPLARELTRAERVAVSASAASIVLAPIVVALSGVFA